jgi:hypothetical protein
MSTRRRSPDVERAREAFSRLSDPPSEDTAPPPTDELDEGAYHVGRIREAHERLEDPAQE